MQRLLILLVCSLFLAAPAGAAVEIVRGDKPPVTIQEIYLRNGILYLPADELLTAVGLSGQWNSVEHLYRMKTPVGTATVSPGSRAVRLDGRSIRLSAPALFIDNRLRLPDDFIQTLLPVVLPEEVRFRNLDPASAVEPPETPAGRFLSLLLRKDRGNRQGPPLRAVLLDPGHGGSDIGSFAQGVTEKTVALETGRRLEKLLKMRLDIPVYLTRDGDYTVAAQQRLETARRTDIDAMLLLHAQSSFSPTVHGVTLVIRPQEEGESGAADTDEGSLRLALQMEAALRQAGLTVNGIFRAPLVPLGRGNLPTVLIELGYLSNDADRNLLREVKGQEQLAEALYAGIRNFAEEQRKEQGNAE